MSPNIKLILKFDNNLREALQKYKMPPNLELELGSARDAVNEWLTV
jgi:hypothetical protein